MASEDVQLRDFWTAMGEEFSLVVCPPVAFEDASPQECCEPLREVLGQAATPWTLPRARRCRTAAAGCGVRNLFRRSVSLVGAAEECSS